MKVVFLNIWGGRVFEPFMEFVKESAKDTDFFCFQEMLKGEGIPGLTNFGGRSDILERLTETLPQFDVLYHPSHHTLDKSMKPDPTITVGTAIFSKKGNEIKDAGKVHVQGDNSGNSHDDRRGAPHYLQYVRFEHDKKLYTLCNMHGTARPGNKLDTPERLEQSKRIADFLKNEQGEKILGGDFNLMPETESIRIIESAGMRNLIKDFNISTTRSELNYKRYPENERQYFSDYVFASSGIKVEKFEVPQLNISDHLPLVLEFT